MMPKFVITPVNGPAVALFVVCLAEQAPRLGCISPGLSSSERL